MLPVVYNSFRNAVSLYLCIKCPLRSPMTSQLLKCHDQILIFFSLNLFVALNSTLCSKLKFSSSFISEIILIFHLSLLLPCESASLPLLPPPHFKTPARQLSPHSYHFCFSSGLSLRSGTGQASPHVLPACHLSSTWLLRGEISKCRSDCVTSLDTHGIQSPNTISAQTISFNPNGTHFSKSIS